MFGSAYSMRWRYCICKLWNEQKKYVEKNVCFWCTSATASIVCMNVCVRRFFFFLGQINGFCVFDGLVLEIGQQHLLANMNRILLKSIYNPPGIHFEHYSRQWTSNSGRKLDIFLPVCFTHVCALSLSPVFSLSLSHHTFFGGDGSFQCFGLYFGGTKYPIFCFCS